MDDRLAYLASRQFCPHTFFGLESVAGNNHEGVGKSAELLMGLVVGISTLIYPVNALPQFAIIGRVLAVDFQRTLTY